MHNAKNEHTNCLKKENRKRDFIIKFALQPDPDNKSKYEFGLAI